VVKDIFVPADVFENVLLGYNRSHRANKCEKVVVFPFSIIVMATFNGAYAIALISGFVTFGLLWPESMKMRLFTVKSEKKKRITSDEEINNDNMTATMEDISKMKDTNNKKDEEITRMSKEISEIKRLLLLLEGR